MNNTNPNTLSTKTSTIAQKRNLTRNIRMSGRYLMPKKITAAKPINSSIVLHPLLKIQLLPIPSNP